uniref:Uncharacterized protein n=1 Tax=Arundo donax TaxID=35708 RepID=A0A0A9F6H5_ARUDO
MIRIVTDQTIMIMNTLPPLQMMEVMVAGNLRKRNEIKKRMKLIWKMVILRLHQRNPGLFGQLSSINNL